MFIKSMKSPALRILLYWNSYLQLDLALALRPVVFHPNTRCRKVFHLVLDTECIRQNSRSYNKILMLDSSYL